MSVRDRSERCSSVLLPHLTAGDPQTNRELVMTLVNREREIDTLQVLLRDALAGRGGAVLLQGPVGIGKSVLLRHLTSEARLGGTRVLAARCDSLERDFPFGVVRQLFEPVLASLGPEGRDRLLAGLARPALRALDSSARHDQVGPATDDVSHAVLHGLYWFTCHLAEESPLVIVVDDAHCADLASLRFLTHLARRMQDLPVLLAVSVRTNDGTTDAALLEELAAHPHALVLRPRPLSLSGVSELVREAVGRDVEPGFYAACLDSSGGNPLLVCALLTMLKSQGASFTVPGLERAIADGGTLFDGAVLQILRQLPAPTLAAARAFAVLGEGCPPEVHARLAGLNEAALGSAVRTLAGVGLMSAVPADSPWSFNHGLVREVILADMPPAEHLAAHRQAARLLLDAGARAEQVAGHLTMPDLPVTEPLAVGVLREAAREASVRGAPAVAVELLRHALREQPDTSSGACVLAELGLMEVAVDVHASVRHLQSALEHVDTPLKRFRVLASLASGLTRTGQVPRAVRLLAEHGPAFEESSPDLAALVEAQRRLIACEDLTTFRPLLDEPRGPAGMAGDTPGERALLAVGAAYDVLVGQTAPDAARTAERVIARSVPGIDSPYVPTTAATVLLHADRPEDAAHAYRHVVESAWESDNRLSLTLCTIWWAEAAYRAGRLSDAEQASREVLAVAPEERWEPGQVLSVATRVHVLLETGDVAGADELATRTFPETALDGWHWNEFLSARGRLSLRHKEPREALADLLECGRRQRQWQRHNPAVSTWWYWAARAHLRLEDPRAARALAEEAADRARAG
ncbi:ATP-binding protein, partial [Streptomyces sparsus]